MAYVKGQPFIPQFTDPATGLLMTSGTIEFYLTGTSTPTPYYTDSAGTSGGTSLTLDSGGQPSTDIYFDTGITYKLVVKNAAGTTLRTIDPFSVDSGISATNGTSLITHTQSGTDYNLATYLQNRHEINVRDYGAVGDGVTDDTTAIQAAINAAGSYSKVIIPKTSSTYISDELYVDADNIIIECRGIFDMTGKTGNLFALGQKSDGNVSDSSRVNIDIVGLTTTGDKTAGSTAIYFRKCSTCRVTNPKLTGLNTPIRGETKDQNIACIFINPDIRGNTYGFYDTTGAFQACCISGGRIEQNDNEGIVLASVNFSLTDKCIVEGNGVTGNTAEIRTTSLAGQLTLDTVYMEMGAGNTATGFIENDSVTLRLDLFGCNMYGNDASNRYILDSNVSLVTGALNIVGGNYHTIKNYTNATFTGNSIFTVHGAWAETDFDPLATATVSGGATYDLWRRTLGNYQSQINTLKTYTEDETKLGVNVFKKERPLYLGLGAGTGSNTTIIATADLTIGTTTVVEVTLIGRQDATTSRMSKDILTFNSDGTLASQSNIAVYNMTAPTYSISGADLVATQMSNLTTWSAVLDDSHFGFSL